MLNIITCHSGLPIQLFTFCSKLAGVWEWWQNWHLTQSVIITCQGNPAENKYDCIFALSCWMLTQAALLSWMVVAPCLTVKLHLPASLLSRLHHSVCDVFRLVRNTVSWHHLDTVLILALLWLPSWSPLFVFCCCFFFVFLMSSLSASVSTWQSPFWFRSAGPFYVVMGWWKGW